MKIPRFLILAITVSGIFLEGCMNYFDEEKFNRPDWLAGKLYTAVAEQGDLTQFAECLRIVGLDTLLDVSGCYTVFAPDDDAVDRFLAENQYSSVSDIPKDKLERICKFHIIQNPWSLEQLQTLSIYGWVDDYSRYNEPDAYKRQTLLKNPNEKYWIKKYRNRYMIVEDSTTASDYRKVFVKSRKYVPIFYDQIIDIFGIEPEDYSFYFDREYEPGNVYYAGARVIRQDIFAENGFVHVVDRMIKPMLNAREMLQRELPGESYKVFLDFVYKHYPSFESNMEATRSQPAYKYGGIYDTLWDLNYEGLAFDLHEELTRGQQINYTLNSHNGMFIPTDEAFQKFTDEILTVKSGFPHWPDLESLPEDIIHIIVDHHFQRGSLYPSDIRNGLNDGYWNTFYLNEEDFIRKEFGSNCTFMGLNRYVVSRFFSSITGPVFLRPEFSYFRHVIQDSYIAWELTSEWGEYSFFPVSDVDLKNESSLIMEWVGGGQYNYYAVSQSSLRRVDFRGWELGDIMRNQVGSSLPNGSAIKEFIRTLGGNYIIWNNAENTVSGSRPTTFGYEGDSIIECHPILLGEPVDNGKVWYVNSWFNFGHVEMFPALSSYPAFLNLLEKAGLFDPILYEFPFIHEWGYYTIFIPSEQALAGYQADTLSQADLADFLLYHFIEGDLIFTDNKVSPGYYWTPSMYGGLNIRPGPDIIEILDDTGTPYVSITEAEGGSNIMVTMNSEVRAVIHEINTVLIEQ